MEIQLGQKIKNTFRHSGVYGLGSLLKGLVGLLLIPIYTNYLSVAEFGRWGLLFAVGQVMRIVIGLGLVSAVFRSYFDYDNEDKRRDVLFTAVLIQAASSVVFLVVVIFFSRALSAWLLADPLYQYHVIWITVYAVLFGFHRIALALFRAREESFRYILFEAIGFFAHLGLAILLMAVFHLKLMGAVWGLLAGSLITTGLSCACTWKDMRGRFSAFEAKRMLAYGLPTIVTVLSILVINFFDRYLIKVYLDFVQVGLYELGYHFGMVLLLFFATPVRLVWEPMYLSVKDQPRASEYYSRVFTYGFLIGTVLFLVVSLFSSDVIRLIAREGFWTAARVVPVVALGYLVFGCERLVHVGIGLSRRTYIASGIFLAGAALNIVLNIWWIPIAGIMGAALATLVTALLVFTGVYIASQRFYKVDYEWRRVALIASTGMIIYYLGNVVLSGHGIIFVVGRMLLVGAFPVVLGLSGFFVSAEKNALRQLKKRLCKQ